jgi:AraC-like DNA-binding protein
MSRETVGVENPFKQYEEEFIFKSYTVEQMAARCNISESAFKHHFFEHYHKTPYQWLRMQRLSLAAQTLVEEDLSIKQISNKYQFSKESHFIKCFKQQFGLTPKNFRKEYRKQE